MSSLYVFFFAAFFSVLMNVKVSSAATLRNTPEAKECKAYEPMRTDLCVTFTPPDIEKLVADAECRVEGSYGQCITESIYYRTHETLYFPATGETVRRNTDAARSIDATDHTKEGALKNMRADGAYFAKWLARNKCPSK